MAPDSEGKKQLTLEDIARLSGYAPATVSRTINNQPNVSARARQKILAVIQEYGYQPHPAAQALASARSKMLMVLIPQVVTDVFGDPFFHKLLQAATLRANAYGYSVMLELTSTGASHRPFYERSVNSRLTDGFMVVAAAMDDLLWDYLTKQEKPYLVVGHPLHDPRTTSYVDTDNLYGAYAAVTHLIERGAQRIGTVPGRTGLTSTRDRLEGYRNALHDAGRPVRPEWIAPCGDYTEEGGYAGMLHLLKQGVDAVFCANDKMAIGAMRALKQAGRRIPDDVAIVGFDDSPLAALTDPGLTSVRQNVEALGSTAAEGLIALIEGREQAPYHTVIPVELVVRGSS